MSGRELVLKKIAAALDRPESDTPLTISDQPSEVSDRLRARTRSTLPAVPGNLTDSLIAKMESVSMSVVRLQSVQDCIAAVEWYLETLRIDGSVAQTVTVSPELSKLPWPSTYASGKASGLESVGITACVAAVAETGSIVTNSGPASPATLNFLPETHIIIVYESQVVKYVDDVFALLRSKDVLPRAVNFVTGPSRTADIEQTLEIGAHGPKRMHVLLVAGQPESA
jgi:L-lactate dehydrogenase complex protein LldG